MPPRSPRHPGTPRGSPQTRMPSATSTMNWRERGSKPSRLNSGSRHSNRGVRIRQLHPSPPRCRQPPSPRKRGRLVRSTMLRCHRQRNQGDRARSGRAPGPAVPGEVLPESSLPSQRIPTQQDEGRGADQCQDEDPETSNHNLREQDEEGNFIHSSDNDQRRTHQVDEDLQQIRTTRKAIPNGRRDFGTSDLRRSRRGVSFLLPH